MWKCCVLLAICLAHGYAAPAQTITEPSDQFISDIYGGRAIPLTRAPYYAYLTIHVAGADHFTCGAVILEHNKVLTAAHCVSRPFRTTTASVYAIHAGVVDMNNKTSHYQTARVEAVSMSDRFRVRSPCMGGDIAVLQLATSLQWTTSVQKIAIVQEPNKVYNNDDCWITGYGVFEYYGWRASLILNEAGVTVMPRHRCQNFQAIDLISDDCFCVGDPNGVHLPNTCQGDSGGPLTCRINGQLQLAGITSYGMPCGYNHPSGFVDAHHYSTWITNQLQTTHSAGTVEASPDLQAAPVGRTICRIG